MDVLAAQPVGVSPSKLHRSQMLSQYVMGASTLPCIHSGSNSDKHSGSGVAPNGVQMEAWLDQMLTAAAAAQSLQAAKTPEPQPARNAAAAYGMTRSQLLKAGVAPEKVETLYNALYSHSIGFFDVLQDALRHCSSRGDTLHNVWSCFLAICESALRTSFESEYLQLYHSGGRAMSELMVAKEALTEAREKSTRIEKDAGDLVASHAEERMARLSLKARVDELQAAFDREHRAHAHAVSNYVAEMEARSQLQLQLQDSAAQIAAISEALRASEIQQQMLASRYQELVAGCGTVREVLNELQECLASDAQLNGAVSGYDAAMVLQEAAGPALPAAGDPVSRSSVHGSLALKSPRLESLRSGVNISTLLSCDGSTQQSEGGDDQDALLEEAAHLGGVASEVRDRVKGLYAQWRSTEKQLIESKTEMYHSRDELRVVKEECRSLQSSSFNLTKELESRTQELTEEQQARAAADKLIEQLQREQEHISRKLTAAMEQQDMAYQQIAGLRSSHAEASLALGQHEATLQQVKDKLARETERADKSQAAWMHQRWLMAQHSKGLAVAMTSLYAQQTARGVLKRQDKVQKERIEELEKTVDDCKQKMHTLTMQVQQRTALHNQLKTEKAEMLLTMERLETEHRVATDALATRQGEVDRLKAQLAESEEGQHMLEDQMMTQTRQLGDIMSQNNELLTEVQQLHKELDNCQQQIRELTSRRTQLVLEVDQLQHDLTDAVDKAVQEQARLELQIKEHLTRLSGEQQRCDILEIDLHSEQAHSTKLQALLEQERLDTKHWQVTAAEREQAIEQLQRDIVERGAVVAALELRLEALRAELKALDSTLHEAVELPASVSSCSDASEAAAIPVKEAQVLLDTKQAEARQLDEQVAELDSTIASLESRVQSLQLLATTSQRALTPEERTKLKELRVSIADLSERRMSLEKTRLGVVDQCRGVQGALRHAQQGVVRSLEACLAAQATLAEAQAHGVLMAQVQRLQPHLDATQEELRLLGARAEGLRADRVADLQRLQQMTQTVETHVDRITVLEDDKIQMKLSVQKAHAAASFLQLEISSMKADRDKIRNNLMDKTEQVRTLERELLAAREGIAQAKQEAQVMVETQASSLEKSFEEEKGQLLQQFEEAAGRADAAAAEIARLQARLSGALHQVVAARQADSMRPQWLYRLPPLAVQAEQQQAQQQQQQPQQQQQDVDSEGRAAVAAHFGLPMLPRLRFSYGLLAQIISQIYLDKITANVAHEALQQQQQQATLPLPPPPPALESVAYDYFLLRLGVRSLAEAHLHALNSSVHFHRTAGVRITCFGRLMGLFDPVPPAAVEAMVIFLDRVHSRCGPLVGEAAEGNSQVNCDAVVSAAKQAMTGGVTRPVEKVMSLAADIRIMGGSGDLVDLDIAFDLTLQAWLSQRAADEAHLQSLFRQADTSGSGLHTAEELQRLLRQVGGSPLLSQLQPQHCTALFREALMCSGTSGAVTSDGFTTLLLDRGYLRAGQQRQALEPVRDQPPFNECRLLEASWAATWPAVQTILETSASSKLSAATIHDTVPKLERAIKDPAQGPLGWQLYQQVALVYNRNSSSGGGGGGSSRNSNVNNDGSGSASRGSARSTSSSAAKDD